MDLYGQSLLGQSLHGQSYCLYVNNQVSCKQISFTVIILGKMGVIIEIKIILALL